ncbi:hypothetical protein Vadar_022184 [Vaccinium darrowii]|uniref:Uncharacterized protein n=1 Tax=Vaccinium darrowii TaxID=229202 RepID=A0ACB7YQS2_9ERIC|nr:hypothetical protein Vadar_022184 [Vaccinium darrowii]
MEAGIWPERLVEKMEREVTRLVVRSQSTPYHSQQFVVMFGFHEEGFGGERWGGEREEEEEREGEEESGGGGGSATASHGFFLMVY